MLTCATVCNLIGAVSGKQSYIMHMQCILRVSRNVCQSVLNFNWVVLDTDQLKFVYLPVYSVTNPPSTLL